MLAPLGPHAEYGPCQPCGAAAALYRGGGTSPFLSLSSHLTISPIRGLRRSSSLCEHFAAAAMPHTPEVVPSDSSTIYSTQLRVLTLNVHGWHNEANLVPACASLRSQIDSRRPLRLSGRWLSGLSIGPLCARRRSSARSRLPSNSIWTGPRPHASALGHDNRLALIGRRGEERRCAPRDALSKEKEQGVERLGQVPSRIETW